MSRRAPRIFVPLLAAALLASAGIALASTNASGAGPPWATVNVCNPSQLGVRASLPGTGARGRMQVRFSAQWLDPERGWTAIEGSSASPWVDAGSSRYAFRQAGWTFSLDPRPPGSAAATLRGVAEIQWLRGGGVVRSTTRVTSGGQAGVDAGSPPGTSLATCELPRS